jgi:hypothetical protein
MARQQLTVEHECELILLSNQALGIPNSVS